MLKRVIDLPTVTEAKKVYERIRRGSMSYHEDSEGYALYDTEEFDNFKPKKKGRPLKQKGRK